jgi:hypothetical protein
MPTVDEVIAARVRADIAEKMLEMLRAQLAEMTEQRDRWEQRFDQLILSALRMPANGGPGGVESAK